MTSSPSWEVEESELMLVCCSAVNPPPLPPLPGMGEQTPTVGDCINFRIAGRYIIGNQQTPVSVQIVKPATGKSGNRGRSSPDPPLNILHCPTVIVSALQLTDSSTTILRDF